MSILNSQRSQKGIQRLGTEWVNQHIGSDSCIVRHTNGKMYSIFARNFLDGVIERRLYTSWSSDGGVTWSAPLQLTAGYLDDMPTAIQLDLNDTASNIGVVYRSSNVVVTNGATPSVLMRRFTIDVDGAVQTPLDSIGAGTGVYAHPSLVRIAAGFMIIAHDLQPNTIIRYSTNTVFENNSWSAFAQLGPQNFFGASTNQVIHAHAFNLASSHIGVVGCVRTSLDGSTSAIGSVLSSIMAGNLRSDVFVAFSSDEGANWGSPQNLTNYSGTPALDLVGIESAISAKGIEMSDGSVTIAFQEGKNGQFCNVSTSLAFPASYGLINSVTYNPVHDHLLVGVSSTSGTGGLIVYDLANQTRTILNTSSTPALWSANIKDLAVSSDGKYLAVASDLSLDIVDMTDATIANWTVTGLRTTSSPATRVNNIIKVMFDSSGYSLYAAYGPTGAGVAGVWGLLVDASSPTAITDLLSGSVNLTITDFFVTPSKLYIFSGSSGKIGATSKTTGLALYDTAFASTSFSVGAYDDVNGEIIANFSVGANKGVQRYLDTGSAFTLDATYYSFDSAAPTTPCSIGAGGGGTYRIAGSGVIFTLTPQGGYYLTEFYSFGDRTLEGPVIVPSYTDANLPFSIAHNAISRPIKSKTWLPFFYQNGFMLAPITHMGRLRWGVFTYNSSTKQVNSADFYDALNFTRFDSTTPYNLRQFGVGRDANDQVYFSVNRMDLTRSSTQIAVFNGTIEPDAYKAYARARILNTYTVNIQGRARMQVTGNQTVDTKGRIVLAVCVQARAHIVPVVTQQLTARARIYGVKASTLPITYSVQQAMSISMNMRFFTNNGRRSLVTGTARASIVGVYNQRFYGSFIVSGAPSSSIMKFDFAGTTRQEKTLDVRAFVVR